MEEFQAQYELWMSFVHRDCVCKFMYHKQVEYVSSPEQMANPTVTISKADFATAIEVQRIFSATCAFPERFNVFCLVSANHPKVLRRLRRVATKERGVVDVFIWVVRASLFYFPRGVLHPSCSLRLCSLSPSKTDIFSLF